MSRPMVTAPAARPRGTFTPLTVTKARLECASISSIPCPSWTIELASDTPNGTAHLLPRCPLLNASPTPPRRFTPCPTAAAWSAAATTRTGCRFSTAPIRPVPPRRTGLPQPYGKVSVASSTAALSPRCLTRPCPRPSRRQGAKHRAPDLRTVERTNHEARDEAKSRASHRRGRGMPS